MAYATLADLKAYLGISTDSDDSLLSALLDRATAAIDRYTGRHFTEVSATRTYDWASVRGDTLWLDDDLLSVEGITDSGKVVPLEDVKLLPRQSPPYYAIRRVRGAWGPDDIAIVGKWGYSATPPADIVHACIRLAAYYYRQRDAQVFDTTAIPDQGVITVPRGIPADVKQVLDRYRRLA